MSHLVCQSSHFRCRGSVSQDGSLRARPQFQASGSALCPPLGLAPANHQPVGSADGIRGSWVKKRGGGGREEEEEEGEGEGEGGGCSEPTVFSSPLPLIVSFNYASALFSGILHHSVSLAATVIRGEKKGENRGIKQDNDVAHGLL